MSGKIVWVQIVWSGAGLLCYGVVRQYGENRFGMAILSRREYACLPAACVAREDAVLQMRRLAKARLRPYQLQDVLEDWAAAGVL